VSDYSVANYSSACDRSLLIVVHPDFLWLDYLPRIDLGACWHVQWVAMLIQGRFLVMVVPLVPDSHLIDLPQSGHDGHGDGNEQANAQDAIGYQFPLRPQGPEQQHDNDRETQDN